MMREQRLIFGEDAELYDKARPSYPPDLVDDVIDLVGTPCRAVDVGCGTGKAAVLLAQRGVTGVGLEADPAMAAVAARNLAPFTGWTVAISDFERFVPAAQPVSGSASGAASGRAPGLASDAASGRAPGLASGAASGSAPGLASDAASGAASEPDRPPEPFDLITCAQAWHWLDLDVRFRRAHALLRPGGRLALWWNRPDQDDSALRRGIDALYQDLFPTISPNGLLAGGRPPVGPIPAGVDFGEPIERAYPWVRRYSTSEWIDLVRTHSNHRLLPREQLARLCQALGEVIDGHGGCYDHHYSCWLWTAQRR